MKGHMWRVTLTLTSILMFVFWFIAETIISPTYNLLARFAEAKAALPIVTQWAFVLRPYLVLIPIAWLIISLLLAIKLKPYSKPERNELVTTYLSMTLVLGFVMTGFFILAAVLAVLKMGAITA